MQDIIFTPSDFVAVLNQTLEFSYPTVVIEGELVNFRVSKNRWVYFDLKDELALVSFFGTIYQLPGPLEDGLVVRAVGVPRMHPRFGFSVNFQSLQPVGEGSLKKAADLLFKKLQKEGLFEEERKRLLPALPSRIGLITAAGSAAASDFVKILNERWGGTTVDLMDVYVQGEAAAGQLSTAIEHFNQSSTVPDVLVITRGGGSAEDLAAFNDERVVRAVAGSRVPTLVAIGHEVDVSLAELAADKRASTPSNAVQLLVPDKKHELQILRQTKNSLAQVLQTSYKNNLQDLKNYQDALARHIDAALKRQQDELSSVQRLLKVYDPQAALRRGYTLIKKNGRYIKSAKEVKATDELSLQLSDGIIKATVRKVLLHGKKQN